MTFERGWQHRMSDRDLVATRPHKPIRETGTELNTRQAATSCCDGFPSPTEMWLLSISIRDAHAAHLSALKLLSGFKKRPVDEHVPHVGNLPKVDSLALPGPLLAAGLPFSSVSLH